jgi:hypothetical protein
MGRWGGVLWFVVVVVVVVVGKNVVDEMGEKNGVDGEKGVE